MSVSWWKRYLFFPSSATKNTASIHRQSDFEGIVGFTAAYQGTQEKSPSPIHWIIGRETLDPAMDTNAYKTITRKYQKKMNKAKTRFHEKIKLINPFQINQEKEEEKIINIMNEKSIMSIVTINTKGKIGVSH